MIHDDLLHLKNIADAIDLIDKHQASAAPLITMQQAVAFEIIKIGEAAAQLSSELKKSHTELPWRLIIDTRNRFIHGYYDIDYDMMWDIVKRYLPEVKNKIKRIIDSMEKQHG